MSQDRGRRYRVAQWATGNIGAHALRAVIEHPQMELVGLWAHSADKQGHDAGELCGLGRKVGVKATRSLDDILAAKPDCVLYMPQYLNVDEVCRLLESGVNIATSVVEFHHPPSLEPEVRARVEEACRRGGSSIHATGASPGFISETLPLALMTLVRRLDLFQIDEYADMTSRDSPGLIFEVLGFGKPPRPMVDDRQVAHIRESFGQSFRHLADSLSMPLDRIEAAGEFGAAKRRTEIAAGVIEAGTVAALRLSVTGFRGETPAMRFRANWYCAKELEQDWDLRDTGWRVQVQGDTPLDISIRFPVSEEEYPKVSPGFTAHPVVNAVPAVVAAEPGIRTAAELKVLTVLG
jgi:4-hydroxy-tetrahydrodipicolinate reductase